MSTSPKDALNEIAHWIATHPADWSDDARCIACNSAIDTIACMIAGAGDPVVTKLTGLLRTWGDGPATLIGQAGTLAVPWAAMINGAAAHVLDYDDNFDPAKAHASAVLFPALIALGEARNATSAELLDAYIVGLQVMGHVGQAVNPFHRNRGWHATCTMGAIGAAAGCARLLKLDEVQSAHAVSMATSRAGGFMSQFGTDTKPLHAGFAASGGVQSALMAEAGLTAGSDTLDGPTGLRMLMVGPDVEARAEDMAGKAEHGQSVRFEPGRVAAPLHIEAYGLKVKRYPNCGSVHRALDLLLQLRETHSLTPDNVKHIKVRAPASHLRNLMYVIPTTPSEAKFSLEYNLAAGLKFGKVGLRDFTPEAILRPDVHALFERIERDYVEKLESEFPTEVHITLTDGTQVSGEADMPIGSKKYPLTRAQIWQKYEDCAKACPDWSHEAALKQKLEMLDSNMPLSDLSPFLSLPA